MRPEFLNFFEPYAMYEVRKPLPDVVQGTLLTFVKIDQYWNRDLGYDVYEVQFVEKDVMIYELMPDGMELQEEVVYPERFFCKISNAEPTLAKVQFQQRKAKAAAEAAEQERQRIMKDALRRLEKHQRKAQKK